MKKRVFSLDKFKEDAENGMREEFKPYFDMSLDGWAKECDGLTEEELNELGYKATWGEWYTEVDA